MSHSQLAKDLLDYNARQSESFCSPDAKIWRQDYRERHSTEIAAFKCMDGRLNLSVMSNTPPGIIQPYRNVGGKFDLGWPHLYELVKGWVDYSISQRRRNIIFETYHWSKGDRHRGCAGFDYKTEDACAFTEVLKAQVEDIFGSSHRQIYPVRLGIETDSDSFLLHGEDGKTLDLFEYPGMKTGELESSIDSLFPDMRRSMRRDLVPILKGNLAHIEDVKAEGRDLKEMGHYEQIIALGRGFDWLHLPNPEFGGRTALIIGPYSFDLTVPVATAAKIVWGNIESGVVDKKEGIVLFANAAYRFEGPDRVHAIHKARSLAKLARDVIGKEQPDLAEHVDFLVGITDLNTRRFTEVGEN